VVCFQCACRAADAGGANFTISLLYARKEENLEIASAASATARRFASSFEEFVSIRSVLASAANRKSSRVAPAATVGKEEMRSVSEQQVIEMPAQTAALEQHYSVADVAGRWGLSVDTVRRLFEHESGVIVIEPTPRGRFSRRRYRTLRIPAAIVERVHRRLSVVSSESRISVRNTETKR